MSATVPWGERRARSHGRPHSCYVRAADEGDLPAIVAAVRNLLIELGATPAAAEPMREAAAAILAQPDLGVLLLAEIRGEPIGFLGVSWQSAVRVPGRYALIQELWVHSDWRRRDVGAELLAALFALAPTHGISRIEVGLPGDGFPELAATEAFYARNGFSRTGTRMRRLLG